MKFAQRLFRVAGLYGLVAIIPQYFMEGKIGRDFPPAVTHPEHFYGFLGVALAWQFVFFLIGNEPVRYRPIMLFGAMEKCGLGFATIVLYSQHRLAQPVFFAGLLDLAFAALFLVAYARTPSSN